MDESNSAIVVQATDDETVNSVLASQARERGTSELWTTTGGGAINALLLWTQFPGLHWLAGAFAAVAAYGAWGLLDRELSILELQNTEPPGSLRFVSFVRGFVGVGGWAAALFAALSLLTAAVGTLSLPGR